MGSRHPHDGPPPCKPAGTHPQKANTVAATQARQGCQPKVHSHFRMREPARRGAGAFPRTNYVALVKDVGAERRHGDNNLPRHTAGGGGQLHAGAKAHDLRPLLHQGSTNSMAQRVTAALGAPARQRQHGTARQDTAWHGRSIAWYDTAWHSMAWHGTARHGSPPPATINATTGGTGHRDSVHGESWVCAPAVSQSQN